MLRPMIFVVLALLLGGCQTPMNYAAYEGYMESARSAWPVFLNGPFPDPFTDQDAERLHEAIAARTGLQPGHFPGYRSYFAAAHREAARREALRPHLGVSPETLAERLPAADAARHVRAYLGAVAGRQSTYAFWLGAEPPRAFERLLDHDEPAAAASVLPVDVPGGTIACREVAARCRIVDDRGHEGWQTYTFLVTGSAARPLIWAVR